MAERYFNGYFPEVGDVVKVVSAETYEDRMSVGSMLHVLHVESESEGPGLIEVPWKNSKTGWNCPWRFALIKRADGTLPVKTEEQKMRVIKD